jgi:hypothetical protein
MQRAKLNLKLLATAIVSSVAGIAIAIGFVELMGIESEDRMALYPIFVPLIVGCAGRSCYNGWRKARASAP